MLGRVTAFFYGVVCYLAFLRIFPICRLVFLETSRFRSQSIPDRSRRSSRRWRSIAALLGLFALQHSVMARQWFKAAWTRIVPGSVERSTYVLFSSFALLLLFWKWQPMGGVVWKVESAPGRLALEVLFACRLADCARRDVSDQPFRSIRACARSGCICCGRPYTPLEFRTPGLYRYVRHPLYVGWLLVFWSAPVMTAAHLVFAIATTAYILVAIQFEERDLVRTSWRVRRVSPPGADDSARRFLQASRSPGVPGRPVPEIET